MPQSLGLARIIRHEDGTATAEWAEHELKSAFQPIFAFRDGKLDIVAYEGLLRPFFEGQPILPPTFFAAVPARDRFAIETLSRTLHLINAGACLGGRVAIFINFDPSVFTDRSLADMALRDMRIVLHEAGIDPRRIVCEVTEQRSSSPEALYSFVSALRTHGFRIAVDDYGSEESDINRIKELRPDIVKFDARWISRLMDTGAGFALLKAMVESFDTQGISTVFEGIE
ncbi:MAG: EAL domain-containing protein, partial [Rhizobiaceae bacterium]|nr:EAL domain-containing protein [Rhizobiaceae bacterium]